VLISADKASSASALRRETLTGLSAPGAARVTGEQPIGNRAAVLSFVYDVFGPKVLIGAEAAAYFFTPLPVVGVAGFPPLGAWYPP
jgi:hypothetical protein